MLFRSQQVRERREVRAEEVRCADPERREEEEQPEEVPDEERRPNSGLRAEVLLHVRYREESVRRRALLEGVRALLFHG